LSADLLKHLLSLEKLEDHDLCLTFIKVNFGRCEFGFELPIIVVLLREFPRSQPAHQLSVVVGFHQLNRALSLEETTKLLPDVSRRIKSFLFLELVLKLAGLLVFLFTLHHLPLHLQSLTGLLEVVSAFERLKLALEVLQESLLLLLSQTFILIALLDLLLALFNSLSQMSRIFVHILLEFLLASKHLIVVAVAILQLVLVLRLKCLLL